MKKLLVLAVTLLMTMAITGDPASAANKGLKGYWIIKYYSKNGALRSQQCIRFVQTNNIAGYSKFSGTWVATANGNLNGQWVQNGDDIMWYGASGKDAFFSVGDMTTNSSIGGTGYAQFKINSGATQAAGNWTGKKTNRC